MKRAPLLGQEGTQGDSVQSSEERQQEDQKEARDGLSGDTDVTLVSALRSAQSISMDNASIERKKTPFGILRIAKQKDAGGTKGGKMYDLPGNVGITRNAWNVDFGTRGLLPVRQRTQAGRIEIDVKGNVILASDQATIKITADGHLQSVSPAVENPYIDNLYQKAVAWLRMRRRRSSLCSFLISPTMSDSVRPSHVASNVAICSIMANGPFPDYTVTFRSAARNRNAASSTDMQQNCIEHLFIRVEQRRNSLLLVSSIESIYHSPTLLHWRQCVLSIKRSEIRPDQSSWVLSEGREMAHILRDLTECHLEAMHRSLEASSRVNSIFDAAMIQ